jgi:FAD/FMN-containing dehydrogenase
LRRRHVDRFIITADGNQLRVSHKQNEDLFWALRGGGGNFGIVTAFEYQVHQLTEVYGGFLLYPIEMLGEYLRFYRNIMTNAPDELMIELSVSPSNPPMLVATVCYSGNESSSRPIPNRALIHRKKAMDTITIGAGQLFLNGQIQQSIRL